jgi:hypothetical protein
MGRLENVTDSRLKMPRFLLSFVSEDSLAAGPGRPHQAVRVLNAIGSSSMMFACRLGTAI